METLSPRRASKINSFCSRSHNKGTKNPYSTRGLDKFSALLAELEEKKQKIYSQRGSEDISLVRFVYKDTDDFVPIVVKVKKEKTKSVDDIKETSVQHESKTVDKFLVDQSKGKGKLSRSISDDRIITKKKSFSWNEIKLNDWRRPSYYLPAAIILILLFLVFFGRSFAILCTSIGWYMVPTLQGENSSNEISQERKKKYVRGMSEIKTVSNELSSPKSSNNCGAVKVQSPKSGNNSRAVKDQSRGLRGNRKSW
ncbi:uncharacterized protein LOC116139925 [Pistacia vera]|uniref:uncharacterized protein LOC116139925 n=1 Tax=Pistacia vera TaxID=55513 RepID=UPI001263D283|nr:uncharacterized protein LOC116139925 [Pistacia vera]